VAQRVVKLLARRDQPIHNARVGILGFTFKENVSDIPQLQGRRNLQ